MDTSAIVSIQDLLRDHEEELARRKREAELAAQREEEARAAAVEKARADEARRVRAAADAAEAKRLAEERHVAEIGAMAAAAIAKAHAEALAAERAAAARANAAHAEKLASIANDRSKKRWRVGAVVSAIALGLAVVTGAMSLRASHEREVAAATELSAMRDKMQQMEADKAALAAKLASAQDPETIAKLRADMAAKDAEIAALDDKIHHKKPAPTAITTTTATAPTTTATQDAPCTCMYASDPFCDHTRHCKILHPDPPAK